MSSGGRRRVSKWDLKEEFQPSLEDARDSDWPGKPGMCIREKESQHGWIPPEGPGRNGNKWSVMDSNDKLKSKRESRLLSREPLPKIKGSRKSDGMSEDFIRNLKTTTEWDGGGNYSTKMSPGLDEWRQLNRHHSPEDDWQQLRRSRSRSMSRSRSRSRSRSPIRGVRRQSGFSDRSKTRSGVSAPLCKDFAAGRCRRGNNCQFLHQGDQVYEDSWESRNRKARDSKYSTSHDSREQSMRSGRSDGVVRGPVNEIIRERENGRRDRDASLERGNDHGSRKSADIPCKFFAAGHCRNGKHCRFSHHGEARVSPDRRSRDDRWGRGHNSNDVDKLWNGAKWSNVDKSEAAKSDEEKNGKMGTSDLRLASWSVDDGVRHSYNEKGTHGDLAIDSNEKEALNWKIESAGVSTGLSESKGAGKWLGDMEMSPEWNYRVQSSNNSVKGEHGHISQSSQSVTLNEAPAPIHELDMTKDASGWRHERTATPQAAITENSYFRQDPNLGQNGPHIDLNFSANTVPAQSFDHNGQISSALPFSSLKAVAQSQLIIPADSSMGSSINIPENDASFEGKCLTNKPNIGESNTSQVNPATHLTQNTVSSEQLTQLTNLSASLAQLLGSGQQLPQLYAALNTQNAMQVPPFINAGGPAEPDSSVTIQPNQVIASQKQYDPICDSIEPKKLDFSANTQGFPLNPIAQKNIADEKPEIPPNSLASSFVRPNGDDYKKNSSSEEVPSQDRHCLKQEEPGANYELSKEKCGGRAEEFSIAQGESKIPQEAEPLDNGDGDNKAVDSKKSKDVKGIRAFKFALVELVKELLKPTWKEGQMSKEAYKNIVKKVVDKVTSTLQGGNIPQTQDKIDQYLSASKPKLTKLVQAYVEKFQKS